MSSSLPYPPGLYTASAFLGFTMCAIPLPWHLESWNTGTCLYMVWTGLACLNQFINSIVWNGNAINWAPVWCDISSRFIIGSAVAIPAASLCINRRLYHIAAVQTVTITRAERRRAVVVDLAIGLGIPVVEMALQYTVQGHRFDIYEYIGCYPFTYNIWPAFLVVDIWPILIGLVSAFYCILSIRAFYRRQAQFNALLALNSNLTAHRYLRLMCLAGIEVLCTVPLAAYFLYLNAATDGGPAPFKGWADTHSTFSHVNQWPALLWQFRASEARALEMTRWVPVVCALLFFFFFGFADEARRHYRMALYTLARTVGYATTSSTGEKSKGMRSFGTPSLPAFVRHPRTAGTTATTKTTAGKPNNASFGALSTAFSFDEKLSFADAQDPYTLTAFSGTTSSTGSTLLPPPPADDHHHDDHDDDEYAEPEAEAAAAVVVPPPALARPEAALDVSAFARCVVDAPHAARRPDSAEMV